METTNEQPMEAKDLGPSPPK